jgi:hypothetical protein
MTTSVSIASYINGYAAGTYTADTTSSYWTAVTATAMSRYSSTIYNNRAAIDPYRTYAALGHSTTGIGITLSLYCWHFTPL